MDGVNELVVQPKGVTIKRGGLRGVGGITCVCMHQIEEGSESQIKDKKIPHS